MISVGIIERTKAWLESQGFQCSIHEWSDSCGLWGAGGIILKVRKSTGKRWRRSKKVCNVRFWNHGMRVERQYWTFEIQELKDESLLDREALYRYIGGYIK